MPVGQLARLIDLSHATVTSILDRLEKRGLVSRIRSTVDKRRVMVGITEAGNTVLAGAPPLLQEQFVEQFQRLSTWEQTLILSSLQRLAAMMNAQGLDASSTLIGEPRSETTQGVLETNPVGGERAAGREGQHTKDV